MRYSSRPVIDRSGAARTALPTTSRLVRLALAAGAATTLVAACSSGSSGSTAKVVQPLAPVSSFSGLTLHLDDGNGRTTTGVVTPTITAPKGTTDAQVSVDPTFAGASWQAVGSLAPLHLADGGNQLVYARVRSGGGAPSKPVATAVDVDLTWSAATASAKKGGRHQASWASLVAPSVLQVRIEEGRVVFQGAAPNDLVIGRTLQAAPLDDATAYHLDGQAIKSVSRVSRPLGRARLAGKAEASPMIHDLYLTLGAPLALEQPHTLTFPGDDVDDQTFTIDPKTTVSTAIHVNQVGFAPADDGKTAFVSTWTGAAGGISYGGEMKFDVLESTTGTVASSGVTTTHTVTGSGEYGKGDLTGAETHVADFSAVRQPGTYRLCVATLGCSPNFAIDPDGTWKRAMYEVAKSLYHQRSGVALEEPYTAYVRPAAFGANVTVFNKTTLTAVDDPNNVGHDDRFTEYPKSTTGAGVPGAWGGHFDAGDWNSRIQHLDDLRIELDLVRLYPKQWSDDDIPESGDAIPDLVDEGLWDLDQFMRIQSADGGIPGNIDQSGFGTGTETSWRNNLKMYVFAPDVWSTYIYAGVAAEAAVVLQPYDQARAATYAVSATKAMTWAESHWANIGGQHDALAGSVDPQRATAAAAMLMLTRDDHWNDVFADASTLDDKPADLLDCPGGICDSAWVYASVDTPLTRPAIRANAVESLRRNANAALQAQTTTDFGWIMERPDIPIVWGLGPSDPHGIGVLRAFAVTGEAKYRTAMVRAASFTLGGNPLNQSFVTGLGANTPRYPLLVDAVNGGAQVWPGTVEYGIHDFGQSPDDDWAPALLTSIGTVPDPTKVPVLYSWYDMSTLPMMNEFTVQQSDAAALWTFGVLAATATAGT